jgi:hypothetical protein
LPERHAPHNKRQIVSYRAKANFITIELQSSIFDWTWNLSSSGQAMIDIAQLSSFSERVTYLRPRTGDLLSAENNWTIPASPSGGSPEPTSWVPTSWVFVTRIVLDSRTWEDRKERKIPAQTAEIESQHRKSN